jgi:hypothetical protein
VTTASTPAPGPTTRIVIVSGNEYSVPIEATEKDLREHLSGNFPDIANATLQKGTRVVDGIKYETWEFVKRAGTKGLSGSELAAALVGVPPVPVAPLPQVLARQLRELSAGTLSIEAALAADLPAVLAALPESSLKIAGMTLCQQLDAMQPAPAPATCGW